MASDGTRLEPVLVVAAHRAPLNELETDRPHVDKKDHRQRNHNHRTRHERALHTAKLFLAEP
jgi:hypothetical protein